jgi:hypothetical protein
MAVTCCTYPSSFPFLLRIQTLRKVCVIFCLWPVVHPKIFWDYCFVKCAFNDIVSILRGNSQFVVHLFTIPTAPFENISSSPFCESQVPNYYRAYTKYWISYPFVTCDFYFPDGWRTIQTREVKKTGKFYILAVHVSYIIKSS